MVYGWDKWQAKKGKWRVPEKWLHAFEFLEAGRGSVWSVGFSPQNIQNFIPDRFLAHSYSSSSAVVHAFC